MCVCLRVCVNVCGAWVPDPALDEYVCGVVSCSACLWLPSDCAFVFICFCDLCVFVSLTVFATALTTSVYMSSLCFSIFWVCVLPRRCWFICVVLSTFFVFPFSYVIAPVHVCFLYICVSLRVVIDLLEKEKNTYRETLLIVGMPRLLPKANLRSLFI